MIPVDEAAAGAWAGASPEAREAMLKKASPSVRFKSVQELAKAEWFGDPAIARVYETLFGSERLRLGFLQVVAGDRNERVRTAFKSVFPVLLRHMSWKDAFELVGLVGKEATQIPGHLRKSSEVKEYRGSAEYRERTHQVLNEWKTELLALVRSRAFAESLRLSEPYRRYHYEYVLFPWLELHHPGEAVNRR